MCATDGGASLLRQTPAPDANVLLQINSRLQAVLEDLITKNMRLQVRSPRSWYTQVHGRRQRAWLRLAGRLDRHAWTSWKRALVT